MSRLCSTRLAEADAGIEAEPLARDAGRRAGREARGEKIKTSSEHPHRSGRLHGPRLAQHVHEHDRSAGCGPRAEARRIAAERGHVVDDARPGLERRPHHPRVAGVDRDGNRARSASARTTGIDAAASPRRTRRDRRRAGSIRRRYR